MIIREYLGVHPQIDPSVFVAENAAVIGDVVIGSRSSIWYGVVVRGDVFHIRIGEECSIQDNSVIHVTRGRHATLIGNRVTVGHGAILHGCEVVGHSLIGMGATVMDACRIGRHCIVAAGSLVSPGTDIPEGHLAVGAPARVRRRLTPDEISGIEKSADHYCELGARYLAASS